MAAVAVGSWSSCTLKGAKDEAEAALKKENDRSTALEGKVKELVAKQATLETRIRDLEREKALLAERKVEPVKAEPGEEAAAATAAKTTGEEDDEQQVDEEEVAPVALRTSYPARC